MTGASVPYRPNRRALLKGALVLAFTLPIASGRVKAAALADGIPHPGSPRALNGFVLIDENGITLTIPNVEMGQGIYTAEAMLMAEELEVGLDQISVVAAPSNPGLYTTQLLGMQGTGGSTSIRSWWESLRVAGATARAMLISAAANEWKVEASACHAERGRVIHSSTGRSLEYTELAAAAALLPAPKDTELKNPASFALIGKSHQRLDTPDKVNGKAIFGLDVRIPGMKVAVVTASPVFGGKVAAIDSVAALAVPGALEVLRIDDAVAVVASNTWAAQQASRLLVVTWDEGPNAKLSTADIRVQLEQASLSGSPLAAFDEGDALQVIEKTGTRIDAVYDLPFLAHATMEPINTIVHVRADACDIWCGTQVPSKGVALGAAVTGLPLDRVTLHNQLIGGGFGRRLEADSIEQAVKFAQQVTYPLQVVWMREEDIQHDYYRPAYHDKMSAALRPDGLPAAVWHRTTGGSVTARYAPEWLGKGGLDSDAVEGSKEIPYDIPSRLVEWVRRDPPEHLPFSWWRGVGPNHNVFIIESFIDELAHAAGQDPVTYRRKMLSSNPRALAVLDLASEMSGWNTKRSARSGAGISLHQCFGSFCALVVEIDVSPHGDIQMKKATSAIDCGFMVNPDTVTAQIEGGTIFGLSAALYSGIEFQNGRTLQSNFHDYRILRIDEAPRIEVHHIRNAEKPGGIGEVGTTSAAPALANAIFAATGVRLRKMPFEKSLLAEKNADKKVVGGQPLGGLGLAFARNTLSGREPKESMR